MSTRNSKTTSSPNRWWLSGAVLVLVAALFVVLGILGRRPESAPAMGGAANPADASEAENSPSQPLAGAESPAPRRPTRSSLTRTAVKDASVSSQFPQVERLLTDTSLSEHQAAEGLCGIVRSRELSEDERDEALAHGLNLDFTAFAALATDPSLPEPLAQRYLDALANRSHLPKQQIEGYLGLMNHGEESIRTQVLEQLAFLLENEALAETPDELRRAALERFEALKLAPSEQDQAAIDGAAAGQNPE